MKGKPNKQAKAPSWMLIAIRKCIAEYRILQIIKLGFRPNDREFEDYKQACEDEEEYNNLETESNI